MTVSEPGRDSSAPLSRRQLRELERRRALEEAGQDPDATDADLHAEEGDRTRPGFAAPVPVDVGATGSSGPDSTELGYEEFTRELNLDQMLTRRELRALYEARRAELSAIEATDDETSDAVEAQRLETERIETERIETERIEEEHEAVLMTPVTEDPAQDQGDPADAEDLEVAQGVDDVQVAQVVDDLQLAGSVAVPSRSAAVPLPSALPAELSPAEHWSAVQVDPAISTSSIVLPAAPSASDGQAPNGTGEIIVTGTIDLPRDLAATGAHPSGYDSAEIDRMIDAADGTGELESGVTPVRASRAIGSQSARAVPAVPRGLVSLPVVLAGTGGVLIVGVAALLVVAIGLR